MPSVTANTASITTVMVPQVSSTTFEYSSAILAFVSDRLFPHLKFIRDKKAELAYSTAPRTLCHLVVDGTNSMAMPDVERWWNGFCGPLVARTINRLRNDRSQSMKRVFMGKCFVSVCTNRLGDGRYTNICVQIGYYR